MAAGDHNPSRRALLGAAVGIPLMAGDPPPSFRRTPESILSAAAERRWIPGQVRDDELWREALAAFEAAAAEVRVIEAATAGHAFDDEEALLPAHEAACDAMEAALGRAMLAAAPDWADFAVKLGLLFEHELEPGSAEEEVQAAVLADVRRLAGR